MQKLPAAVLFDLDGVILDSEQVYFEAMRRAMLDIVGYELTRPEFDREFFGRTALDGLAAWVKQKQRDVKVIESINQRRREYVHQFFSDQVKLYPDGVALLGKLSGRVRLGLVSSSNRRLADEAITLLPDPNVFEVVVGASDAPKVKPHPDPYLMAMHQLNLSADDCVAIEDSPTGVTAARAAGLRVIAVVRFEAARSELPPADLVVDSLSDSRVDEFLGL
jgi:HAD superfamily hydrolase (TIGR01509 family)